MIQESFANSQVPILGIDPGFSGALALVDMGPPHVFICDWVKMPHVASGAGGLKKEVDITGVADFIDFHKPNIEYCVIEDVSSMPGQGVVSVFSFGKGYGTLLGILGAKRIKTIKIKPSVWKMGLGLSQNKMDSINMARRIFLHDLHVFEKKNSDGAAEASLIAYFAHRFQKGF